MAVGVTAIGGKTGQFGDPDDGIPVVPLTSPDVQDVIDALLALDLVTQSD